MPVTARELAFRILSRWYNLAEPPFLPERGDVEWQELSPRDRAFAFDLLTGVMRRRGTLDVLIAAQLRQPLDTLDLPVRVLLWIGAYQLLFQSGTAAYAAVDSTVDLAKSLRQTAKAGGLVNAVLRGITRLHPQAAPRATMARSRRAFPLDFTSAITLSRDLFPNPHAAPDAYLAATTSHPASYAGHLRKLFGDAQAELLLIRNNLRPTITFRVDADSLDAPASAGLAPHSEAARFVVAAEGWNTAIESLVARGILSPQDPTAAKAVRWLAGKGESPKTILDWCAGLGTKTLQLARAFPDATVTATDVDHPKLSRLEARARQVKQANIAVRAMPTFVDNADTFDLVLVDVPCSNTGVMAKRVQSRWRWSTLDHVTLHALQAKLLQQAAARLAPGGLLVYSTCSIDPGENERILESRPATGAFSGDFSKVHEENTLPSLSDDPLATHDGGYFCVLRRST